jgi:hypothetical protein
MTLPIEMRRVKAIHPVMGSIEFFLGSDQMRWYKECQTDEDRHNFLAHEAWRELFKGPAKRMLTKLCDELGTTFVKNRFTQQIKFETKEA